MTDAVLVALLVGCLLHGKLPSIATILAAVLTYRVLPRPYDEGVTGMILVVGGMAAKRRMARDREF